VQDADTRDGATAAEIQARIRRSLRTWRLRLAWQRLLNTLAAVAVLALAGYLTATPWTTILLQSAVLTLVFFLHLRLGTAWRRSNPENFVEHLNRHFPDFEESAGLLLAGENTLTPLQSLQRERVLRVYRQNLSRVEQWRNPVRYKTAVGVVTGCLLLGLIAKDIVSVTTRFLEDRYTTAGDRTAQAEAVGLNVVAVRIEPPAYTGLQATESAQLDLELAQGSRVEWVLDTGFTGQTYTLKLSGGEQLPLQLGDDGHLHASAVIERTDLYRIVSAGSGQEETIGGIHSLTVDLDHPPDIRIVEPRVSALEIAKSAPARFKSEALVRDDYGLRDVEILASVAKGSGEGVKFRDQTLQFDQASDTAKGKRYTKEWDLEALGMEPGDEVYFTVIATDNRQPEANTGRSETLIVRWLDEDQAGLAAEGLGIDFLPEFFKSQRQIIIDTEQLLTDRPQLAAQHFKDTSYEIGRAQADLKEKYGQYLGDEFGEGPGDQLTDNHPAGADAAGDHEQHAPGHTTETNRNLNSTADIILLYGHNHGDPEVGPITRRNPVALMKRAVSEMWQAERHLMQAEPELALPFEYEAYKYLKLARQADRIYVKRLGFEPPPVTEDNRLKGQLDEIRSYRLSSPETATGALEASSYQLLLKQVYQILKEHTSDSEFSDDQRESIQRLGREFTAWSQQRPTLIRHAASLEKLALGDRLDSETCNNCRPDLESAIWNLIDDGDGQFHYRVTSRYDDDGLVKAYMEARRQSLPQASAGDPR